MTIDLDAFTRAASENFGAVLRDADPAARVPTCPDWSVDDLLWHLTEVQHFWATVIGDRITDPAGLGAAEAAAGPRPAEHAALADAFGAATATLLDALAAAGDDEPVWTWGRDQSVRFVRHFQAHEATMHGRDAAAAAGVEPQPLDPALASDGIRVVLTNCFSWRPGWSSYAASGVGRVQATDTGTAWLVETGGFSGTSPDTGKTYDNSPLLSVVDAGEPAFTVSGPAAELDLWLWGRGPADAVSFDGDAAGLAAFRAAVAQGVQ